MKMIKFALLGTAALAAVTVSARANELSDLKAQIEALNARFDAQAAVPAGYQLMQIGKADAIVIPSLAIDPMEAKTHYTASIVPAADMPASTVVQWSGNVKAAITYSATTSDGSGSSESQVKAKWGLKVVGTTDTAVGEVGVKIAFAGNSQGQDSHYYDYADYNPDHLNSLTTVAGDGYWGWWKITPELTLGGGRDGSLSGNGEGFDGKASANFAGGDKNGGYGLGDIAQMRLSYASGPIAAAVALEDSYSELGESNFGVAGELKFSGDTFGVELNAGTRASGTFYAEDAWTVNAGAHFALGGMGTLSAAAGMGSGNGTTDDYTKASVFASVNLSDVAHAELGASHKWNTQALTTDGDWTSIGGGVYYTPVSQLTIGLEADYSYDKYDSATNAALVTVFSF